MVTRGSARRNTSGGLGRAQPLHEADDRTPVGHALGGPERALLVVDDEAEVTVVVRCLPPALGERDELVADVDECHAPGSAAKRELEDAAVELERLLDVPDLQRDVVDSYKLCPH